MEYETIRSLSTNEKKWLTTKQIVKCECPSCGYDRGILAHSNYASAGLIECNNPNCKEIIEEI